MKVKDVDELDKNWQMEGVCENVYVWRKLALLGPAICLEYNHDLDEIWLTNV